MPTPPDPIRADQVDELDLLGWVEGDLPRARQQPVEDLLAREPRLRALLDAMADDRETLRSLPEEPVPADLLSRVEAQLERDLLVGLSGPSTDSLAIPVSRVVVKGDGILARIGRSPALRYAPLAASILIVGAIGLVMWPSIARRPGMSPGSQPPTLVTPDALAKASLPAGASEAAPLAEAPLAKAEPVPSLTDLAIAQADIAESLSPADESVTPDRAAELLRAGRLAIRVRTLDRDKTFQRLASIHAEPRPTWALLDRADESVIAAFTPAPAEPGINTRLLASREPSDTDTALPALSLTAAPVSPRAIYIAEVDATPRALATLRGVLGSGSRQVAEFIALDAPVATPAPASIESILWWKRPPSAWVERHTLPVLVDPVESPR